jgi:hypothetical protein
MAFLPRFSPIFGHFLHFLSLFEGLQHPFHALFPIPCSLQTANGGRRPPFALNKSIIAIYPRTETPEKESTANPRTG